MIKYFKSSKAVVVRLGSKVIFIISFCTFQSIPDVAAQVHNFGTLKIVNGGYLLSTADVNNVGGIIENDGRLELNGSFLNKGVYRSAGDDSLLLTGSISSILNSGSASFNYLQSKKVNNSGITLAGTATITTKFDLLEGSFSTDPLQNFELIAPTSALFTFGSGIEITGKVRRINWTSDRAVVFHSPYMEIKTYGGSSPTSILVNMIPSGDPTLSEKEVKRYFHFSTEGGKEYMADVTFPYKSNELNVNNEAGMAPWYYSTVTNKWINRVTGNIINSIDNYITSKGIRANVFASNEWKLAEVEYNSSNQNLFVYPVPAKNTVAIVLISAENNGVTLSLIDAAGKLCRVMQANVITGINNINLNISGLTPGHYSLRVLDGKTTQVKPIIIL